MTRAVTRTSRSIRRARAFYTLRRVRHRDERFAGVHGAVDRQREGVYFDQVYPPYGLLAGVSGREHIVAEDNDPAAFADGPKIAADDYPDSPNRDVVYETWTNSTKLPARGLRILRVPHVWIDVDDRLPRGPRREDQRLEPRHLQVRNLQPTT